MKTVFFCGHKSPYGLAHLESLLQSNFNVIAVVLATNKRWKIFSEKLSGKSYYSSNRYTIIEQLNRQIRNLIKKWLSSCLPTRLRYKKPIDIANLSKKSKVSFWYEDDVNSKEFIQRIKDLKLDLILCAAYPQIFSKQLISVPTHGAINFHPSLLPKFRGAHPHYWAIVKGEEQSGLTAHFMTECIDDGDIIAQIKFPIKDYNYGQLYEKIVVETPNLIRKVEDFFLKNKNNLVKQDSSEASYFRNAREIHHCIFWNIHTAKDIFNLVRGGNAFCFFRGRKIIVEKCFVTDTNRNLTNNIEVENGVIVDLGKDYIAVKANSGVVNIQELRHRYRNLLAEFIIRYKPLVGEKFG